NSNTSQVMVSVANMNPAVNTIINPSVDCQTSISLTPSFSDPGAQDMNWTVDINWGDLSAHTIFAATTQGTQPNQTHTYALPGIYTVHVTVTDKDGGSGYDEHQVTVNQTYTVKFLPPFDGSTPSNLIANTMKAGRVVPVKVTLFDLRRNTYVTGPTTSNVPIGVAKATPS